MDSAPGVEQLADLVAAAGWMSLVRSPAAMRLAASRAIAAAEGMSGW